MPPHLHRRPPLLEPMPSPGRVLLLPPHHPAPGRQPKTAAQPPLHLPPAFTRRSLRHPGLHRRGPPAHRLQRNRPPPRRPPPLRPPDRQPQPPQTTNRHQNRTPDRRRDHHRPRPRHPRPAHRHVRARKTQKRCRSTPRAHPARQRKRRQRKRREGRREGRRTTPAPDPITLPTLQATADNLPNTRQVTSNLRRCLSSPPNSKDVSFQPNPERAQRVGGAVEKSASPPQLSTSHLPTITRGSYTPYPPAHHAYKRSFQSRPASDRRRESHIRGPQSPYSSSR